MNSVNHHLDDCFEKYNKIVIRRAYLIVKNQEEAEDICQEVFCRLEEKRPEIAWINPKAWLLQSAKHLALDHLRKGGKYKTILGLDETMKVELFGVPEYPDPSEFLLQKEEFEKRGNVLGRLRREKPEWYEVICMSYIEEMDNRTIAKTLGISSGLVSQWKRRAQKWLQKAYEEERDR